MVDTKNTIDGINIETGEEYEYTIEEVGNEEPTVESIPENGVNSEGNLGLPYQIVIRLHGGQTMEASGDTSTLPKITLADLALAIKENGEVEGIKLLMGEEAIAAEQPKLEAKELSTHVRRQPGKSQDFIEGNKPQELPGECKGKRKMGCLPILLVPVILVGLLPIDNAVHIHEEVITEIESVGITISGDRNPGLEYWAEGSGQGQEEMTNRFLKGDGKGSYNMHEQADIEQESIDTYTAYANTTTTIKAAIGIINNSNSTQAQIEQALQTLEEQFGIRVAIREEVRPQIEEMKDGFKEAAEAHPDSRTQAEEQIIEGIANEFYRDTSAENSDLGELQDLNDRLQKGEKIGNWKITRNEYGDYVITAQHVRKVVKVEEYRGLKAILHELKEALGISKDVQNTTENIVENEGDVR